MEVWKPIEDFPGYLVSNHGQIKSEHVDRVIGTYDNGNGHLQVVMRQNGKAYARSVARLVAYHFIDPMPHEYLPRHMDGDRHNNHVDNLMWLPRALANKMTRQDRQLVPTDPRPILMVDKSEVYNNALECAKAIQGLEELVLLCAHDRYNSRYKGSSYEFYYG